MSRIPLAAIAHVTYQVTDLDLAERFLTDFGMVRAARTDSALYMRGAGAQPYVHVARLGATDEFVGIAFEVDAAALAAAAALPGAEEIGQLDAPGGGRLVRLRSPGGYQVDLVQGQEPAAARPLRAAFRANTASDQQRINSPLRQPREAAAVLRLGHAVLWAADAIGETAWFTSRFALIPADYICAPGPEVKGTFLRFDRGHTLVDHHVLLILESPRRGCHHSSFEVLDIDALMAGHEHLRAKGWRLDAGIGRHLLGSLLYDYWTDPFGNRIEHYTDGDIVNDDHRPTWFVGAADETTQWGMAPPPSFFE